MSLPRWLSWWKNDYWYPVCAFGTAGFIFWQVLK